MHSKKERQLHSQFHNPLIQRKKRNWLTNDEKQIKKKKDRLMIVV